MFIISKCKILLIVTVYVNDLIILLDSIEGVNELKNQLNKQFEMTDLGEARCLRIKVTQDQPTQSIQLLQQLYVRDILMCFGMSEAHAVLTPIIPNLSLQ
jgi:hypothetical protein